MKVLSYCYLNITFWEFTTILLSSGTRKWLMNFSTSQPFKNNKKIILYILQFSCHENAIGSVPNFTIGVGHMLLKNRLHGSPFIVGRTRKHQLVYQLSAALSAKPFPYWFLWHANPFVLYPLKPSEYFTKTEAIKGTKKTSSRIMLLSL